MKKIMSIVISMIIAIGVSGCTYTGAVRSNIAPISTLSKTYNGNVALVIDPAINTAEVKTSVGAHTVIVSVGQALNSAITESARLVFPKVSPQGSALSVRRDDIVVQVRLNQVSGNSAINPGFWSNSANVTAQVSIVIEMVRKDGSLIYRQVVTGTGLDSTSYASGGNVQKSMESALEKAVQQVSDQTVTVFITGLNEMR